MFPQTYGAQGLAGRFFQQGDYLQWASEGVALLVMPMIKAWSQKACSAPLWISSPSSLPGPHLGCGQAPPCPTTTPLQCWHQLLFGSSWVEHEEPLSIRLEAGSTLMETREDLHFHLHRGPRPLARHSPYPPGLAPALAL